MSTLDLRNTDSHQEVSLVNGVAGFTVNKVTLVFQHRCVEKGQAASGSQLLSQPGQDSIHDKVEKIQKAHLTLGSNFQAT